MSPGTGTAKGLVDVLRLGPREHVVIVGGGGKTSLCFALADELAAAGKHIITTTTTKIWQREADRAPCAILCPSAHLDVHRVKEQLRQVGHVFVAQRPLESGKVEGIAPETADAFFQDPDIDYLIVEADGAAGRPLKAPAGHEPVIPSSATLVIAVMGLEAMGMPLGSEVVFRLDPFRELTGLDEGSALTPAALATAFQSPRGLFKGTPEPARKIAFLNKSDRIAPDQDPDDLAQRLLYAPDAPVERVIIGSLAKNAYRVCVR